MKEAFAKRAREDFCTLICDLYARVVQNMRVGQDFCALVDSLYEHVVEDRREGQEPQTSEQATA